jgi:RNA polymerase sigma factor (sigma-70 family)
VEHLRDPKALIEASLDNLRRHPKDSDAWSEFYRYFRPQVAAMLFLLGVRKQEDLAELCQEVFYRFLRYSPWKENWALLPDRSTIIAYLRTATRNALSTYAGKRVRARELSLEEMGEEILKNRALWVTGESTDLQELLSRVTKHLSSDDQRLLALLVAGYSLSKIAEEYGISYTAAGVRVHRLKERLRNASMT